MSTNVNQILRSIAYLPLAATAVSNGATAARASVWQQQGTAWTTHYENVLGTSMESRSGPPIVMTQSAQRSHYWLRLTARTLFSAHGARTVN